ncbi:MAG: hypothetical protein HY912_22280 [Desulfomonile tiedjei]|uniref:Zinc-finger domain-containing protein n=1 Tax=Desulfomonile tiedjei TaxID=2358 RepID=A0A9D6V525_9BACT|nr:hypothetical protein [Desulfomonile tiedjei]
MEKELYKCINIVRHYVHLTTEEIQGLVEKSLDPYEWQEVVEHLEACPYCAADLDLLAKIAEDLPIGESVELKDAEVSDCLVERLSLMIIPAEVRSPFVFYYGKELGRSEPRGSSESAVSEVVRSLLIRERKQVWRFWIGERWYPLQRVSICADLLEVAGLSVNELLSAILDDVRDLGTVPGAIEIPRRRPVVLPLADLVPASGFVECPEEIGLKAQPELRPDRECASLGESLLSIPALHPHREKTPESRESAVKAPERESDPCRKQGSSQLRARSGYPREENVVRIGRHKARVEEGERAKPNKLTPLEFSYASPGRQIAIIADRQLNKVYLRMTASP